MDTTPNTDTAADSPADHDPDGFGTDLTGQTDPQLGEPVDVGALGRRMWLTPPGDTLLLPATPLVVAGRVDRWATACGTDADHVVVPFAGVPLPKPADGDDGGRRWAHVNPEALWHPWYWLPDRLYGRLEIETADGHQTVEDDAVWALRLIEETWASGLYDIDTGSWIDVLARTGLDIDNPEDVARIAAWQAGTPDETLDSIDLTGDIDDPQQPGWSIDAALGDLEDIWACFFAWTANNLLGMSDELDPPADSSDWTERDDWTADVLSLLAAARMSVGFVSVDEGQWWLDRIGGANQLAERDDPAVLTTAVLDPAVERLTGIREQFWPVLEAAWNDAPADPDPDGDG